MSILKLIKEDVDVDIVDHVERIIETKLDLDLNPSEGYKHLGGGAFAEVYDIMGHKNKVLRIEPEAYNSNLNRIVGEEFKYVVKVFYSTIVELPEFDDAPIEITVMEKLDPLPEDVEDEMYKLAKDSDEGLIDPLDIHKVTNKETKKAILHSTKGLKELEGVNIQFEDMHFGNLMYDPKTRNYKIIDLGGF